MPPKASSRKPKAVAADKKPTDVASTSAPIHESLPVEAARGKRARTVVNYYVDVDSTSETTNPSKTKRTYKSTKLAESSENAESATTVKKGRQAKAELVKEVKESDKAAEHPVEGDANLNGEQPADYVPAKKGRKKANDVRKQAKSLVPNQKEASPLLATKKRGKATKNGESTTNTNVKPTAKLEAKKKPGSKKAAVISSELDAGKVPSPVPEPTKKKRATTKLVSKSRKEDAAKSEREDGDVVQAKKRGGSKKADVVPDEVDAEKVSKVVKKRGGPKKVATKTVDEAEAPVDNLPDTPKPGKYI